MFSKEEVQQIKKLFRDELGLEVSDEEASRHAQQLVDFLLAVYKNPLNK